MWNDRWILAIAIGVLMTAVTFMPLLLGYVIYTIYTLNDVFKDHSIVQYDAIRVMAIASSVVCWGIAYVRVIALFKHLLSIAIKER